MTAENSTPPRRSRWRYAAYLALALAVLAAVAIAAGFWYARTPRFAARVHRAVVSRLERATGGRVEMRSFNWSGRDLTIRIEDLTIHGREAPGEAPFFHVNQLTLRAKVISFFTPKIALTSLLAQSPTFHLIVYPDGTTNQPRPRATGGKPLPESLIHLAIDNTRVQNGLVLVNHRAFPWELAAGPLDLDMRYNSADAEYHAQLDAKDLAFRLKKATEVHSQLRANIRLGRNQAFIENLELDADGSRLTATGGVKNFASPSWQTTVHGTVDLRQIGALFGIDELRNGAARVNLHAQGGPGEQTAPDFRVSGHVDLRSAEWESDWLRLRNVELHTNLLFDNEVCSLTDFSSVLTDGGRIAGNLMLKHCFGPSAPPASESARKKVRAKSWRQRLSPRDLLARLHRKRVAVPAKAKAAAYQPLEADLEAQVAGVTLPMVMAAVAPRQYWNLGLTTATYGKVTAHWTGEGHGLDVHGDLTMRAPPRLMGLVPVTGSAHADYLGDHRHLVIEQADENTPAIHVRASGLLTLFTKDLNSNLRLDAVGSDLGELDRLLTDLDLRVTPKWERNDLPLKLMGNASFHGSIHGSFFALEAMGHLDSERFQMLVAQAAHPGQVQSLTWDGFRSELSYKPAQLIVRNAELLRGDTSIHATLNLLPDRTGPDDYTYNTRTHITASMETSDALVADLQSVVGTNYAASGQLTAHAQIAGTVDDLQGTGRAMLIHGDFAGQRIPAASIHLVAQGHALEATHLRFAAADGTAAGDFTYDYETGAIAGQMSGQSFKLEQVAALKKQRVTVGGLLGFHVQAAGTTASPIATGGVHIDRLKFDGEAMGNLRAEAHLQSGMLTLTSRADLLNAHVEASGQVELRGNDPARAQLTFTGFDPEPFLRKRVSRPIKSTSLLDGTLSMSGALKDFASIQADAKLSAFTVAIADRTIRSDGPVQVSLRQGKLQLKPLHIQGQAVNLVADGTVDLLHGNRLRLHSQGSIDMALATAIYPEVQATGHIQFVVNANGTASQPSLRGRGQVSHANLHLSGITNGLTDVNGELLFDQDRMVVQQLQGSSGGGTVAMNGFVGYRNGVFVDLTATAKEVRVRYPKGVSTSVDGKLRLLGTADSMLLSGNVEMVRFGIGSTVDLASLAGGGGVSAPIDPSSPLNRVRLDIHVTSAPELGFQNSFASLAGEVNLRIRGTLENPSVLGRVDITEGSASFAGTKYRLQQGDIVFDNPVTISPVIDLEATARVQNYDIIITLHGPPNKLDISYRSEPPLTQADVIALLALGRTNEQATQYGEQQQAGANLTSEALLGGALNAAVSSRVQKLFGVGSVRVDPNFVGTLGESTARVTVEEQVGPSLTLTFATNVNTTAQQLIQAQYDLTRNISVIAVRDEADVFSMYLQIRAKHR